MRHIRRDFIAIPTSQWDLPKLKQALQAAVGLELATIPPYLSAYWSVKVEGNPVKNILRGIFMEEMKHLGLVSNILKGLGEIPMISAAVPSYPGHLPGHVNDDLMIYLAGLDAEGAFLRDVCMAIEYPETNSVVPTDPPRNPNATIGEFYDSITAALKQLKPTFNTSGQLNGPAGISVISSVDDAVAAIEVIKEEGEGSAGNPKNEKGTLSHYYLFAEIFHGKTLVTSDGGKTWSYTGAAIAFPDVYPIVPVPKGGYPTPADKNVAAALDDLDQDFTKLIDELQSAWATGNADDLYKSIGNMRSLENKANNLLQMQKADQIYGPQFQYKNGALHVLERIIDGIGRGHSINLSLLKSRSGLKKRDIISHLGRDRFTASGELVRLPESC